MLYLRFQLGNGRYALEARRVVEVLPLVAIEPLPQAPRGVAGLLNYWGQPVPAIDLSQLALDQPARPRLSTRVILIEYAGADGAKHLLGLVAERATGTVRRPPEDFRDSGVRNQDASYLGPVAVDSRGLIQLVEVEALLPEAVRRVLFQPEPSV